MDNVPNIISTIDLIYLVEIFNKNFNAAKQILNFHKNVLEYLFNSYELHCGILQQILEILECDVDFESNEITNEENQLDADEKMNDYDYLISAIELEQNISFSFINIMNELSNEDLFDEILEYFISIQESKRDLYELKFKKGWHKLTTASSKEIKKIFYSLKEKFEELK